MPNGHVSNSDESPFFLWRSMHEVVLIFLTNPRIFVSDRASGIAGGVLVPILGHTGRTGTRSAWDATSDRDHGGWLFVVVINRIDC